jgi:hypothetical protein
MLKEDGLWFIKVGLDRSIFFLAASGLRAIDAQQPIEISAGKEFNIILESNPTTDYDWAIVGELD